MVAPRVDSTGGVDGLWLVEAIRDVTDSIQSRGWVDPTLAAGGVGLEALGLVVDPVGSLAGMGAAWLIEHVRPLSEALELLAGDPDQITAHAQTWTNIATHTHACADQLTTATEQLHDTWTGRAADAFRTHTATQASALAGIAQAATGIAQATQGAAELVAAVRMLVRDLVAEAIATIAARLPTWAAMAGVTLGIATPWIVSQVARLVAEWVTRIHRLLAGLLTSLANLSPLLARLTDLLTQQRTLLDSLARHDPATLHLADTGTGPEPPRQGEQPPHDRVALPSADRSRIEDDLGKLPRGNNKRIRTVGTESELRDLFETWKRGGTEITPQDYDGTLVRLPDGTEVGYRHTSTSGGATIDIFFTDGKWRKVHINGS